MCRDKDNYHSISVRNRVFSKLGDLTKKVVPAAYNTEFQVNNQNLLSTSKLV